MSEWCAFRHCEIFCAALVATLDNRVTVEVDDLTRKVRCSANEVFPVGRLQHQHALVFCCFALEQLFHICQHADALKTELCSLAVLTDVHGAEMTVWARCRNAPLSLAINEYVGCVRLPSRSSVGHHARGCGG